jgi:hypothetical protein
MDYRKWCSGGPQGMVRGQDREDSGSFRYSWRAEASVSVLSGAMISMGRTLERPDPSLYSAECVEVEF